jgi:DNA (cytosine-5)-methyltransferase 1
MSASVLAGTAEAAWDEQAGTPERPTPPSVLHAHVRAPDGTPCHPSGDGDVSRSRKPRLLDLFCGVGGAAVGYHRAGFDVVGVDIRAQGRFPFTFVHGDAMEAIGMGWEAFSAEHGPFDVIHASPPCQPFTRAGHLMRAQGGRTSEPDLVEPTRRWLMLRGLPWVMENVHGSPLDGVFLCGSSFGLGVRRHRIFESNVMLMGYPCQHREQGKPVGLYGSMGDTVKGIDRATGRAVVGGTTAADIPAAQQAIGIDWTSRWSELKLAIPPAFTEHIGRQLMAVIEAMAPA